MGNLKIFLNLSSFSFSNDSFKSICNEYTIKTTGDRIKVNDFFLTIWSMKNIFLLNSNHNSIMCSYQFLDMNIEYIKRANVIWGKIK